MNKPFEREAYEKAQAALTACIEILKTCRVSVSTDYAMGCAIDQVAGALADVTHCRLCEQADDVIFMCGSPNRAQREVNRWDPS